MKIQEQLAGRRELEEKIALQVMGVKKIRGIFAYWKQYPVWDAYDPECHQQYLTCPEEELPMVYLLSGGNLIYPYVPSYTADIAEAMSVVGQMRGDGFSFKAWQPASPGHDHPFMDGGAVVSFVCSSGPCEKHGNPNHNHHGAYDVQDETLPLAICKAALIALKKEA